MDRRIRIGLGFCSERFKPYRDFKTASSAFNKMKRGAILGNVQACDDLMYFVNTLRRDSDPWAIGPDRRPSEFPSSPVIRVNEMAELLDWNMVRTYVNAKFDAYGHPEIRV